MSPLPRLGLPLVAGVSLALAACATVSTRPPLSPQELAAGHREKAERLGREGQFRKAADELSIALTINPDDAAALARKKQLEARIERAVTERVQQGREALARGAHLEARRHFLAVLALDPSNRVAFEALQNQVRAVRLVAHTVRRGETSASIAERYYGDRSRADVIEEANRLPPGAPLAPGTTVKVPEIPGVPFKPPEAAAAVILPKEEPLGVNPLLADAKDAFERGDYLVALGDVDRLLAGSPQHREGIELKKATLYGLGKSEFAEKKYAESYQALSQLARMDPNYEDSATMLRTARDQLVREHYNKGLHLFREEKLAEAIAEWRLVLEYDPQHANALKNIEQSERLLKGLEERQQPRRPPAPK